MNSSFFIERVAVIGLGLIGCSWVKALRVRGHVGSVSGYDRNLDSMMLAKDNGIIDDFSCEMADVVSDANLVIVSVPIMAVRSVLESIRPHLKDDCVITDVSSVKGSVAADVAIVFGESFSQFVLGHPIAGSECSGVLSADENLYVHHKVIITPQSHTSKSALELVCNAWLVVGAELEHMTINHHDEVLAATSHLPHLLAYSLVDTLANSHENKEIFNYAAGGFRDFTRIAASSPVMWRDIFAANKEHVLKTLELFTQDLNKLSQAIAEGDTTSVMGVLTRAKVARDHFSKILARRAYVEPMKTTSISYIANPGQPLSGNFRVPGDKSISHRSIMLGSLANGTTTVSRFN